jgi:tetratricopeptide (TPR) repeat protein
MFNNFFCFILICLAATNTKAQPQNKFSQFDPRHWGVVLEHPLMKKVTFKKDVAYYSNAGNTFHIDIYTLPSLKNNEKRPAIIFLNGIGERAGDDKVKSWAIYSTWPQLMAAHGYIGISMETDGSKVSESFDALFKFLKEKGSDYNIDADRLGVYAASANTTESGKYLMKPTIHPGIKAAVLYYGRMPEGSLRKDLPVFFVISEGDIRGNNYRNIWEEIWRSRAPWTVRMAAGLPHAFDAFTDNDEARKLVKETISFWQNNLDPVAQPQWTKSPEREIVEAGYWQNHAKSAELMRKWLEKNPSSKDPEFFRNYGRALMNTGELQTAGTMMKKSLELGSTNNFLLINLATICIAADKEQEADAYLETYKKKEPLQRFHYINISNTLYQFKKFSKAAAYCEKALAMEESAGDYYNLGCYYAMDGKADKAFAALNKAADTGYNIKSNYEGDADLVNLKADARWKALMEKLR